MPPALEPAPGYCNPTMTLWGIDRSRRRARSNVRSMTSCCKKKVTKCKTCKATLVVAAAIGRRGPSADFHVMTATIPSIIFLSATPTE